MLKSDQTIVDLIYESLPLDPHCFVNRFVFVQQTVSLVGATLGGTD